MSLLSDDEITVAALMADLPMQRAASNQLRMQLMVLSEGLALQQNPLEQDSPARQHLVRDGETLQIVSVRIWGTPDYWLALADANGLSYPYAVYPGQILQIPTITRDA